MANIKHAPKSVKSSKKNPTSMISLDPLVLSSIEFVCSDDFRVKAAISTPRLVSNQRLSF